MSARIWPVGTAVFGFATLALIVGFSFLPDVIALYPPGEFGPHMSAFQRTEDLAELNAQFLGPQFEAKLAAMTQANALDLFVFIPVYTIFLVSAAAMLAGGATRPLALLAIGAALLGAGADLFETYAQLRITRDWSSAPDLVGSIAPAAWAKYFALAVHALICAAIAATASPKRWLVALVGVIPIIGVTADRFDVLRIPALLVYVSIGFWIVLILTALMRLVRARGA